jgi:hypothetical protein
MKVRASGIVAGVLVLASARASPGKAGKERVQQRREPAPSSGRFA